MIVNALFALVQLHILLQQWRAEMGIVADVEGLLCWQTFECFILAYLINRRFLDGSYWNNSAITVDLVNNVRKAIQLCNTLWWNFDLSSQRLVHVHKLGNTIALNYDFLKFSGEDCLDLIKESLAHWSKRLWQF